MFLIAAVGLYLVLLTIGIVSSKSTTTVDEYVLAGQRIGLFASTSALIATWYGAESLLTLSDEVARNGLNAIWIDPIGIALCLWLAGFLMAPLLYRRQVATVGDLFLRAAGPKAEWLASMIIVPSYFGWIAAQIMAMSSMLHSFVGGSVTFWIIIVPVLALLLSLFGGNASLAWINTALLIIIVVGLSGLTIAILGSDAVFQEGWQQINPHIPADKWSVLDASSQSPWIAVIGAIAVGSVGNLPAIELVQRVRSAKDERTARWSCLLSGGIYLALGAIPILCGLAFLGMGQSMGDDIQVISVLSRIHLSTSMQLLLFLAVIATILSTLTSAAAAPATMLGINLVEPMIKRTRKAPLQEATRLMIQRWSLVVMFVFGTALALSGETAFLLVRDAYGLLLAAIVVPFMGILIQDTKTSRAAVFSSMIVGAVIWCIHWGFGIVNLGGVWVQPFLEVPHELGTCIVAWGIYYLTGHFFD